VSREDSQAAPTATAGLRLCLLATPRIVRPDGAVHALEAKDAALLALLALDGPTHRAKAAAMLWPEASDAQARSNLRQRLFRLRRAAQRDIVQPSGLLRLLDDVTLDLAELHLRLAGDPAAGQGELLGDHDYQDHESLGPWTQAARERWRATRLQLLAQVASELEANQHIAAALPYAQRLVAEEPLLEHGYRRLMRLHYLRGDRAAALAVFRLCEQTLQRELAEPPGVETRELAAMIERSGSTPARPARPVPEALRRPPRMIAREALLAVLDRTWSEGRPALVVGEAGLGKTRLLQEFAAGRPALCMQAGRPGDASAPYALAARVFAALHAQCGAPGIAAAHAALLARLVPTLADAPALAFEPAAVRVAAEEALAAWAARGLDGLVIDDLHFADAASLELLLPLAAASRATPRWLLAVRPAEVPAALGAVMGDDGAFIALRLAPLDAGAVEELLATLALPRLAPKDWATRIVRHASGNPLLILSTLTELHATGPNAFAEAPPSLPQPRDAAALLGARLRRLSAPALHLARVASVAQQDFDAELAAAVLECALPALADPWRELEQAGVLHGAHFAHDLIRDAVDAEVPAAVTAALHRRVAQWLEARAIAPARVAEHWWRCEAWPEAAHGFDRGAQAARALSRAPEELALLQRAAAAHERAGDAQAAFERRARAVHAMLVTEEIGQALALADRLVEGATDAAQRQLAHEARAAVHNELTQAREALQDVAAARAEGAAPASPLLRVALARREATALMRLNRNAEALAALQAVREAALALDDPHERMGWRVDVALALDYNDRLGEAVAAFQEVAAEAEAAQRWTDMAEALGNLAVTLMYLGRLREAREQGERAVALGRLHHGASGGVLIDEMTLAGTLRDLGRFDEALALGTRVADDMRRVGHLHWAANAENDLAGTWLWLGRIDLALKALAPVPADAPDWVRGNRLMLEAKIESARGRPVGDRVERAARLLGGVGRSYVRLKLELERARYADAASAAEQAAQIATRSRSAQQFALAGQALQVRVQALLRCGPAAAAGAAAQALLEHLSCYDMVATYPAEPWWLASQALAAAGALPAARFALDRARHWIETVALPHVPPLFRDSFLTRNPVNVGVRGAAGASRR
jgi:DNA-binding SARP family transcriptional activator/tetratricopeptide (TPR) repeat protein